MIWKDHPMAKPIRHNGKWRIRPIGPDGKMGSYVFDALKEARIRLTERQLAVRKIRLGSMLRDAEELRWRPGPAH
jgi:hypothetical protein